MKKILLFAAAAFVAASASAETKNVIAEMYPGSDNLIGWGTDGLLEAANVDGRDCLKVTNTEAKNFWEVQIAYDTEFKAGTTYYFTMDVKGDAGTVTSGFQQTNGYIGCGNFDNFEIKADWNTVTIKGTAETSENGDPNRWVANLGEYVGTFYISNMTLYTVEQGEEPADNTLDALATLNNGAYDAATKTITFDAAWGWVNWWYGEGDFSEYDNFVLEFEPVSYIVQVMVQYNEGDDQAVQAQPGESKLVVPLDAARKNSIKQIAIQNSEPGTLKLTAAYFSASAGVNAISAAAVHNGVYNLQGVKVANSLDEVAAPGLYISNGKKIIKK